MRTRLLGVLVGAALTFPAAAAATPVLVMGPGGRVTLQNNRFLPGQGIELQVLGTFGEADGYYAAGKADYPKLREVLSEMIPLAAQRGGGKTWELSTSTYEWNGTHSLSVGKLAAGSYTIHLTATDLAGNFTRVIGSLSVS